MLLGFLAIPLSIASLIYIFGAVTLLRGHGPLYVKALTPC